MASARLEPNAGADPSAALVRAELARILASELFTRSERLSSFLTFIVERTLAGEGDSLKEHVIAIGLYGKGVDFNAAADPIVRVDARRLRDRLREYYAGGPDAGVVISVPKGSYTPVFHAAATAGALLAGSPAGFSDRRSGPQATVAHGASKRHTRRRWRIAAAAGVLVGAGVLGATRFVRDIRPEPPRLLTTTSMPGAEEDPALSPDGNFVAFAWGGPAPTDSPDIWIKAVDGDAARRLTDTPGVMEKYPAWSPDGQFVAFTRYVKGRPSILRISALGGREEMIAEGIADADWSPDGKSIVGVARTPEDRSAVARYELETGVRQQLTEAPEGFVELHPAVSPDGRTIAFNRSGEGRSSVFLLPTSGGKVEPLGEWTGVLGGVEWTPDNRELLVARPAPSGRRLMRIALGKQPTEVAVAGIPYEAIAPSVSGVRRGGSFRLAVVSGQQDVGLRLVDLQAPQNEGRITAATQFCDASRMDSPGRFSPDGRVVAFTSDRSGSQQVWVATLDGTPPRMVTQLQDASVSVGSWSPDGRSLAFDATIGTRTHVYVVPVDGGPVRRLTSGGETERDPEWSRDGRWIYYASTGGGRSTIWRAPPGGGAPVRLTSELGFEPRESADGRSIYFVDRPRSYGLGPVATLKRIPADGGAAETLDVPVMAGAWEITDTGLVFLFVPGLGGPVDFARAPDVLQIYDFTERRIRTLGTLAFRVGPFASTRFLIVSRDGRWAVASHVDRWDRDILVVDNFR
jgi:Tol biopolymer transport system component